METTSSHDARAGGEQAGTVVVGRYRLEERLGAGATATVWRAVDLDLGRPVALKLLRAGEVDERLRARFERETDILSGLSHPSLVAVLGAGVHGDRPFIVMEHVEGASLKDLAAAAPLPPERAAALVAAVAEGLGCAHRRGVIHRDVKPANIMVTHDGAPKVVDFGIARSSSLMTMTMTATVLGTAAYLSPEQAQGRPLDARSDTYSLGCVLYELLAGRPPFDGPSHVALAYKHVHDTAAPPSEVAPAPLPPGYDDVVGRALAKEPADRYADAQELADDLRRVAAGEPPLLGVPLAHEAMQDDDPASATVALSVDEVADTTVAMAPVGGPGATAVLPPVPPPPAARSVDSVTTARRRRRPAWVVPVLVVLGGLALLVAVGAALGGDDSTGDAVEQPDAPVVVADLRGMPYDDAAAALADDGLQASRLDVPSEEPAGVVVGQDPGPGQVDPGGTVTLQVSTGPTTTAPPPEDEGKDDEGKDEGDEGRGEGNGKGKDKDDD